MPAGHLKLLLLPPLPLLLLKMMWSLCWPEKAGILAAAPLVQGRLRRR
jgi:hypothetical protein